MKKVNENTRNENTQNTQKKVFNLVIVDESGSMCVIHREALAGINETIETCKKMQQMHPEMEQRMTLITFDSCNFKLHYDNLPIQKTHSLTMNDYNPGGATPLYDAIGKGIAKLNAQTAVGDNVLVTIITDGEENCSREYNLQMVKNLIDKQKQLGWTFTLIGTDNLDVEGMAGTMGIDNHLAFTEDEDSTREMFAQERESRARFNFCCANSMAMPKGSYFEKKEKKNK